MRVGQARQVLASDSHNVTLVSACICCFCQDRVPEDSGAGSVLDLPLRLCLLECQPRSSKTLLKKNLRVCPL